jgi:hypothetical protein
MKGITYDLVFIASPPTPAIISGVLLELTKQNL